MSPDTVDLIERIDAERERSQAVLEDADEQIKQTSAFHDELGRKLDLTDEKLRDALETLERSGLPRRRVA